MFQNLSLITGSEPGMWEPDQSWGVFTLDMFAAWGPNQSAIIPGGPGSVGLDSDLCSDLCAFVFILHHHKRTQYTQ